MKKTIVAAAVLVAAYIGASWWMGKNVEQQHQQWMRQSHALWGDDIDVKTTYERGLFSATSTSVIRVKPGLLGADRGDLEDAALKLHEDIRHGPFPGLRLAAASIHTTLELDGSSERLQAFRAAMADASGPEADSVVGFDGTVTGTVTVPAGKFGDLAADDFHASWDTLTYDFKVSRDGKSVSGTAAWPEYTATVTHFDNDNNDDPTTLRVHMSGMTGRFDTLLDKQWLLPPGQTQAAVSSIQVQESATPEGEFKPLLTLDDLQWKGENSRQGDTLDGAFDLSTQLHAADVTVPKIHWSGHIQRLDERLVQMAQEELLRAMHEGENAQPPSDAKVEAMVQRLLDSNPEYNEKLEVTLPGSDPVRFNWGVAISELPEEMAELAASLPWQLTTVQRLSVHGSLRLPASALKTVAELVDDPDLDAETLVQMAQNYVANGLLREEDGVYAVDAEYSEGEVRINGEPVNLGGLLQMLM